MDVAISRLRKKLLDNAENLIALKLCVTKAISLRLMHGISDEKTVYPVLPIIVCLLPVMSLLVGLVYKFTAERAGKRRWMI